MRKVVSDKTKRKSFITIINDVYYHIIPKSSEDDEKCLKIGETKKCLREYIKNNQLRKFLNPEAEKKREILMKTIKCRACGTPFRDRAYKKLCKSCLQIATNPHTF